MKEFFNKHVILTTLRKSKYAGVVCGFDIRKDKTCLNNVVILQKNGEYKALSGGASITRWFNNISIQSIELDKIYYPLESINL